MTWAYLVIRSVDDKEIKVLMHNGILRQHPYTDFL